MKRRGRGRKLHVEIRDEEMKKKGKRMIESYVSAGC